MSVKKILGIDPSTKTGLSVVDTTGKVLLAREIEFKKLVGFERIQSIVGEVFEVIALHKPDMIVLEDIIVGHASSAITVIQVASILRYYLWQEGHAYHDVSPGTLKKFVAGNGKANKEQMMMFVLKVFGYEPATNNIADAVGLAFLGAAAVGWQTSKERSAIAKKAIA